MDSVAGVIPLHRRAAHAVGHCQIRGCYARRQAISYSGRLATGQPFTPYVFFMNSFLPVVTALPASLLILWQQHRLQTAVADLAAAHAALSYKSAHDGLTGLLNRETFFARVSGAGGFLMIDADNFKAINDTYGHSEGDEALRLIARTLDATVDDKAIVCRLGGEEFGVFMPLSSPGRFAVV